MELVKTCHHKSLVSLTMFMIFFLLAYDVRVRKISVPDMSSEREYVKNMGTRA